jgi:diguanylate cyclase (GGDEF)-like protein
MSGIKHNGMQDFRAVRVRGHAFKMGDSGQGSPIPRAYIEEAACDRSLHSSWRKPRYPSERAWTMTNSVFFQRDFFLLLVFSVFTPIAGYLYLFKRSSVSRRAVLLLALLLMVMAGADVVLIQSLATAAKAAAMPLDKKIFSSEISVALYVLPLVSAGLGINLASHSLFRHLSDSEENFDREHQRAAMREHYADHDADYWIRAIQRHWRHASTVPLDWFYFSAGMAGMALIFTVDLYSGSDIRLHALYIYPVALVAMQCERRWLVYITSGMAIVLQTITYSTEHISLIPYISDVSVASFALFLAVTLASTARKNHLKAIDLATTDALTNIANRRAFVSAMETEFIRQRRYGGSVSLALIDLDGFKSLNDTKGHPAGDDALRRTGDVLRNTTRKSDNVARLGGDEFAILMPNTAETECRHICCHLGEEIARRMAAAEYGITASIGFRTFTAPPESTSLAMQEADSALYKAKAGGKNRIESFQGVPPSTHHA